MNALDPINITNSLKTKSKPVEKNRDQCFYIKLKTTCKIQALLRKLNNFHSVH